jgi:SagB-type dehydrogenase family enzyme
MTTTAAIAPTARAIAAAYWDDALYDPADTLLRDIDSRNIKEGDPREPAKAKTYPGAVPEPLPAPALRLPATDGDFVSTLLRHAYGLVRHDLQLGAWPHHRTVPSARCFFPTELHLVLPDSALRAAGVFYYDAMRHGLVRLRAGDWRRAVGDATGAGLDDADAVVLLTSRFWKAAFRYRDYAHRLCCQEVGIVAGSVLLVARALGLASEVHHLFADATLDRLLGVDGVTEATALVLTLRRRITPPPKADLPAEPQRRAQRLTAPSADSDWPAERQGRTTARAAASPDPAAFARELPRLSAVHRAERSDGRGPARHAPFAAAPTAPRAHRIPVPQEAGSEADLAAVLRTRDSGPAYMEFRDQPAPAECVWRVAREVSRPYPSDLVVPGAPAPCDCYLVVRDVAGIAAGAYRVGADGDALESVPADPVDALLPPFSAGHALNVALVRAPLTVFLAVPRRAGEQLWGARAFRMLHVTAGIAAMRACVASARSGLCARIHNGYAARAVEDALGIAPDYATIFQIAIGSPRTAADLRLPVVF